MALWTVLEVEPSNQKQQFILDGDITKYVLCQENMDYLTEVHLEVCRVMVDKVVCVIIFLLSLRGKFHSWNLRLLHFERKLCHCGPD